MGTQTINNMNSKELYLQYDWYKRTFLPVIQSCCDEFFLEGFEFGFAGLSKNINALMDKDPYFVTKIRFTKEYDVFFRASESAVFAILNKVLGKSPNKADLNNITDLEAKIISSFDDCIFNAISGFIKKPEELRRTNFDVINLTFIIKTDDQCGKFIISLPDELMLPEEVVSSGEKFDYSLFKSSTIDARVRIGSTKFKLYDLKHLDTGDMVIFDNSDCKRMNLILGEDYEREINLNPNFGLVTTVEDTTGGNMGTDNIWDSIEVEMVAEFDAVKISLGELKNIESGMVVDLTSLYNNRVTLKVENKDIAHGELVIVNDRYGVKITDITDQNNPESKPEENFDEEFADETQDMSSEFVKDDMNPETTQPAGTEGGEEGSDEEFDYSDFEIEDEDI